LARWSPWVRKHGDGAAPYLHYYGDRVLAAPLGDIDALKDWFVPRRPEVIDLTQSSPRFDLAHSGSTRLSAERRGYPPPWGLPELRQALVDQKLVDASDETLITPGAAGALGAAFDAFLNPGDRVVLFDPTAPLFAPMLTLRRARIRWTPTRTENGRIRFDRQVFVNGLRGAKMLVLADPANPTGGTFAAEELEQIAWWAKHYDLVVIVDESYSRYRGDGGRSRFADFPGAATRTLNIGSLSKGHALTAARVGWISGHRHLVRPCFLTQSLSAPFVPTLCQQIALAALSAGDEPFEPIRDEMASRRQFAFERVQTMGLSPTWPAAGLFLWVSTRQLALDGRGFARRLLEAKNVLVTPGDAFGPSGIDHIRLSVAGDEGRLLEGLSRLADFVAEELRLDPKPRNSHVELAAQAA
jgi:aspartate/methionine/tyrosine aminotransferase